MDHDHATAGRDAIGRVERLLARAAAEHQPAAGLVGGLGYRAKRDRDQALKWFHATFVPHIAGGEFEAWSGEALVAAIESALMKMRRLAVGRSFAYDLPTHEALLKFYRAEVYRLRKAQQEATS